MTKRNVNPMSVLRWSVYFVVVLLLVAGLAALVVPPYLAKTLQSEVLQQTGRRLTIDQVKFNLLTLTVDVSAMKLYEANDSDVAFSADHLLLKLSPMSLAKMAPILRATQISHPHLVIVRSRLHDKDVTNFTDLFKRLAKHPSAGDPVRFALSNIDIANGDMVLDDRVANKQIHIDAFRLVVPFVSNFPTALDVDVEPYLSAVIDGSKFELKGRTKPFTESKDTHVAIDIDQFNLPDLIPFSPVALPVKFKSAKLTTRLMLTFTGLKNDQHVSLAGTVSLSDLALSDQTDAPVFAARQIDLNISDVNLATQQIVLNALDLDEPVVWAGLDPHGALNWAKLSGTTTAMPADALLPPKPGVNKTEPSWSLAHCRLKNGSVHWADESIAKPTLELVLSHIDVDAHHVSNKAGAPPAKVIASIGQAGNKSVHFDGEFQLPASAVSGQVTLADFALEEFQPYMDNLIDGSVKGTLGLKTEVSLKGNHLSVRDFSAQLDDLQINARQKEFGGLTIKKMMLSAFSMDTENRNAKLGQLALDGVHGELVRDADGGINVVHFMKNRPAAKGREPAQSTSQANKPDWQVNVDEIDLNDSQFVFGDKAVEPAVLVKAEAVNIKLNDVSSDLSHPVKVAMQATLNKTGKFNINGTASITAAQLNLDIQNFAIPALEPYFTEFLNINVEKGSISTKGKLIWNAPNQIRYAGGLKLANFLTADKELGEEFLNWTLLDVSGIQVDLGGKQPIVMLGQINLNDFYARAILSEKGRLNLQNIVAHSSGSGAASNSVQPAKPDPSAAPDIRIGAINLNNGVINYTDNFIKPHYSVRMTGMHGSVGTIDSMGPQSAPIELNGKVDDEAPIAISGSLNPLFSPMLLDVRMTATGVDLPRLTTYALKYAGYPIVKGQLSLDVEYHIKDNHLEANNSLKLDQLTFGDKVDSPDATHLPVPFLISLLTDAKGQINLDLPISGTINDPQFSIGGLIVQVFVNIVEKVVTSPFSLLAQAFEGGAEEMAYVEFEPGSFKLTDAAKAKLDNLCKGLAQRPAVKIDMTGRADMNTDMAGLRTYLLERQIKKVKNLDDENSDSATMTEAERNRAIEKIYSDAKFNKPRNVIGLAKTLPPAEMEKLILANTVVNDDDIRVLALRRESAVRAYLTDHAHIAPERLFSIAPKLSGEGISDQGAISRVGFELKM